MAMEQTKSGGHKEIDVACLGELTK